jgi:hypothetical protein
MPRNTQNLEAANSEAVHSEKKSKEMEYIVLSNQPAPENILLLLSYF